MSVNDPYSVLGIDPSATDDEVKAAYRELAKKYHPDNYGDNPLSELAQEKMQEINEAYDAIVRLRKQGGGGARLRDVRALIQTGRVADAEMLLDGVPENQRDAEWYFLKGSVSYRKGWLEDAYQQFATACRLDPQNAEYRAAYDRLNAGRQTGGYHQGTRGSASACDVCSGLICADCCCECMGGDLISCC